MWFNGLQRMGYLQNQMNDEDHLGEIVNVVENDILYSPYACH